MYVKVLCLVIMNVNMTKYTPQKCQKWQICGYHVCFIKPWILQNSFSAGLCPGSNWGAYDPRPPSRLGRVVGRGTPLPIPFPWILAALVHRLSSPTPLAHRLSGPPTQVPGYAYARTHNILQHSITKYHECIKPECTTTLSHNCRPILTSELL